MGQRLPTAGGIGRVINTGAVRHGRTSTAHQGRYFIWLGAALRSRGTINSLPSASRISRDAVARLAKLMPNRSRIEAFVRNKP